MNITLHRPLLTALVALACSSPAFAQITSTSTPSIATPTTSAVLRGWQDAVIINDNTARDELTEALAALRTPVKVVSPPLTFAGALERVGKYVDTNSSLAARAGLAKALSGKQPSDASRLAAAAVVEQKPIAAVAALLVAQRLEPKSAGHLVNLAGLLCALGLPNEALALLSEAERLGVNASRLGFESRAVLLNSRGRALLLLGQAAKAETALREAVRLDPGLSEAKRNLALALQAQNKKDEALRMMRASMRRNPVEAQSTAEQTGKTPTDPGKPEDENVVSETTGEHWTPTELVFDMSRSKDGRLPNIPYPVSAADGAAFTKVIKELQARYEARGNARMKRIEALQERVRREALARGSGPGDELEHTRLTAIARRVEFYELEPGLRAKWDAVKRLHEENRGEVNFGGPSAVHLDTISTDDGGKFDLSSVSGRWGQAIQDANEAESLEHDPCRLLGANEATACHRAVERKYALQRCAASMVAHDRWRTLMLGLDSTLARAFNPTYRMMSGLLGNISDPAEYELHKLWIEQQVDNMVSTYLLSVAESPEELWIEVQQINDEGHGCGRPATLATLTELELGDPGGCTFGGPYKATVSFEFVELSFNCEKIAVEFSGESPLTPFAEFEYAFEGKLTMFVGAKAGISAGPLNVGPSLKGGLYVTVGSDGTVKDVGAKGSVSGAAGLDAAIVGDNKLGAGVEVEAESSFSFIPS